MAQFIHRNEKIDGEVSSDVGGCSTSCSMYTLPGRVVWQKTAFDVSILKETSGRISYCVPVQVRTCIFVSDVRGG